MKLTLLPLMLAVAAVSAVEDPVDQLIQICDTKMVTALQRVCEHKDLNFLIQNNEYDPEHEHQLHDHKHHHRDHGHHRQGNHSHAVKKDSNLSIAERCCHKPCLVKDFMSYCGDK